MAERKGNVLAFFGQGAGDPLSDFIDLVGDQVADRGDVMGEIEVDAGDRVANLLGLIDQRLTLVGQLREQITDADLVVVVGALERRHLVVDERFKFGRASECTLDAITHGRDFAPDGLADGDNGLAGDGFGLRQAHRHFGHRFQQPRACPARD